MTTLTSAVTTPDSIDVPRSTDVARGLARSTRAELLRLRKWPALWLTIGVELLLNLLFIYVFNYVSYRSSGDSGISEGVPKQVLLERMMPAAIPHSGVAGMPMFGGALVLILGALAAGSGYGWGTVKTVALQGPGRLTSMAGSLAALLGMVVCLVAAMFATDVAASLLIATTESQAVVGRRTAGDTRPQRCALGRPRARLGAGGREPASRRRRGLVAAADRDRPAARDGCGLIGRSAGRGAGQRAGRYAGRTDDAERWLGARPARELRRAVRRRHGRSHATPRPDLRNWAARHPPSWRG
jgi:hypothetical protein